MNNPPIPTIATPPRTVAGVLRRLGPGLIIAASIVGSGELIMTTKTGAQAGFSLLWLIIIGCVIKVFVQVELGRYAISTGRTTMEALDEVPGPRLRVNWLVWYWLVMFVFSLMQLGGIVGGVGQSLAMSRPLTGDFNRLLDAQDEWDRQAAPLREQLRSECAAALRSPDPTEREATARRLQERIVQQLGRPRPDGDTLDDVYWAAVATAVTIVLLVVGRYSVVQNVSAVLVAAFTFVTIVAVAGLQFDPRYTITAGDLRLGLSFRLPPPIEGIARSPLATALAAFGIIGVGATELIFYPYWCLEKGYARFAGPADPSDEWADRARGWLRVMRWDALGSMAIYTFATVAFYLLGAAVLWRSGLDPAGNQMVRTLGAMYVPVFGAAAWWLFLFGAFAVLYSTFFVSTAGHARVVADAIRVYRLGAVDAASRQRWVQALCVVFPLFSLAVHYLYPRPTVLVAASGVMQAIMLPMLAGATLYYRYRRCDPRIAPGRLWDALLWLSSAGLLVAGGWLVVTKLFPALETI